MAFFPRTQLLLCSLAALAPLVDGRQCNLPETGTLASGDSSAPYNTITLGATASPVDDYYTGFTILIDSGTGRYSATCPQTGQVNCAVQSVIRKYVGTTRVATVDFLGATAAGDTYAIQSGCYDQTYAGRTRALGGSGTGAGQEEALLNWRVRVDQGEIVGRPALMGSGDIVVGTLQGSLLRVNSSGETQWKVYAGSLVGGPAIGEDDTVYVGSEDRQVWAFTPTGMTKWQFLTGAPITATPLVTPRFTLLDGAVAPEGVVIGSLDGNVYKLNLDGTLAWTFETGDAVRGAASYTRDGKLLFGSMDGRLYCVWATNGSLAWRFDAGQEVTSRPLVQDVSIAFGTRASAEDPARIIALKMDGTVRWEVEVSASVESELTQDPDTATVYASSNDGKIFAIQADGVVAWRYLTGGAGGVCGNNNKVSDFEGAPSSRGKCSFAELNMHGATSPCLLPGVVVTTSQNKFVYGLGYDGSLKWKYPTGKRIRAPALCVTRPDSFGNSNRAVYAASNDRFLYSLSLPE